MPLLLSILLVLGGSSLAIVGAWVYFGRYQVTRAPLGVFNGHDLLVLLAGIVLIPCLYLVLPFWLVGGLISVMTCNILYLSWEPVLRTRVRTWGMVLAMMGLDIGSTYWLGTAHPLSTSINNLVVIVACIGISNLWVQSGMRARQAALLGALLSMYDLIATSALPLMHDMLGRLLVLPFTPMLVWRSGTGLVGLGLGDVLMVTLFPLVMDKVFGRRAGLSALVLAPVVLCLMAALLLLLPGQVAKEGFPAMVVLGPLMGLQYLYWRRRRGQERTTWQYLQEEPLRKPGQRRQGGVA